MTDQQGLEWGENKEVLPIHGEAERKHVRRMKLLQISVLGMLFVFVLFLLCMLDRDVDKATKILALVLPIVSFVIGRESGKEDS
jgi:hypothetical protein